MTDNTASTSAAGGKAAPKKPTFILLIEDLAARKAKIPAVLLHALNSDIKVLALGTREKLQAHAVAHGYDDEAARILRSAVANLVRSGAYLSAVASEGSSRFDIDGNLIEEVSDIDRLNARLALLATAISRASSSLRDTVARLDEIVAALATMPASPPVKQAETVAASARAKANGLSESLDQGRALRRQAGKVATLSASEIMARRAALRGGSK